MGLTAKQKRFVEFYIQLWNATRASQLAGYQGKNHHLVGPRLLKNPAIQAEIAARMRAVAMDADEALTRLAQQARGNAGNYLCFEETPVMDSNGQPVLDAQGNPLMKVTFSGINWREVMLNGHLVKKLSYDRRGNPVLEFYDAQAALVQIGKHLRLFVEQIDMTQHTDLLEVKIYIPENGREEATKNTKEHEEE